MANTAAVEAAEARRLAAMEIVEGLDHPVSVRNIFYRLVSVGAVEKNERSYGLVSSDLAKLRRRGDVPYESIVDASRRPLGRTSDLNCSARDAMEAWLLSASPVTSIWKRHGIRPHIWAESRSAAGMIEDICGEWEVGLWPAGGQPSLSFTYAAARDRPTHIGYIGDYDDAGEDIAGAVQNQIAEHEVRPDFTLLAVTAELIEEMNLPTRPDTKSKRRSVKVEVEAIPSEDLRELVRTYLESLLPEGAMHRYEASKRALRGEMDELVGACRAAMAEAA